MCSKRRWLLSMAVMWFAAFNAHAAGSENNDQPVSLSTANGTLAGSLLLPLGKEKPPVLLIIAGSGPVDREGNVPTANATTNSLKFLARALAQAGFASVRYDKRGIAASAAAATNEAELRFDTYVSDAAAWITQLERDARFSSVGVIGHSEGSLIGMLAARQAGAAAFVSIAGLATGAAETIRTQLKNRLSGNLAQRRCIAKACSPI
jgi:pimeloyl-ACP methyl ester carboxylesterase